MSAQSDMIQAVNDAEAAVTALAAAYNAYRAAYKSAATATSGIQSGTPRSVTDVAELEHACGPERVAQFTHGRLVALGAERIVAQAG